MDILDRKDEIARLEFESWGTAYEGVIQVEHYCESGGFALELYIDGDWGLEPYAMLTVCLDEPAAEGCVYLDTNNFPEGLCLLVNNGIATETGNFGHSGFCDYPEVKINKEILAEYCLNPENL